jgi:hypothetical protein
MHLRERSAGEFLPRAGPAIPALLNFTELLAVTSVSDCPEGLSGCLYGAAAKVAAGLAIVAKPELTDDAVQIVGQH